jgi:hypothetical protein
MKMINVRGKNVSEDTIVEALKEHCGFEEVPEVFIDGLLTMCISKECCGQIFIDTEDIDDKGEDNNLGVWRSPQEARRIAAKLIEFADFIDGAKT